jgi:hypothetical protein
MEIWGGVLKMIDIFEIPEKIHAGLYNNTY